MELEVREVEITYAAGSLAMRSVLFLPDKPASHAKAVLVLPEAPGPGENVRSRAIRLAALGYPALACDLHGNGLLLRDPKEIGVRLEALRQEPERVRLLAFSAYEALRSVPEISGAKLAALGFCFGGTLALELGRAGADLAGIIGFHCGLAPLSGEMVSDLACPVLACIGADDPTIPTSQRNGFEEEMQAAGVEWALQIYGGVIHAFTDVNAARLGRPEFARYDEWADSQSWQSMLQFLQRIF